MTNFFANFDVIATPATELSDPSKDVEARHEKQVLTNWREIL